MATAPSTGLMTIGRDFGTCQSPLGLETESDILKMNHLGWMYVGGLYELRKLYCGIVVKQLVCPHSLAEARELG